MIELIDEANSSAAIAKKHSRIFEVAEKAWALVAPLIQAGQSLEKCPAHFHVRWVVLAFYARQLRAFRAIILLAQRGLIPEAQKVLRPMIETHLHLEYLGKAADAPATARRYIMWEFANDASLVQFLKESEKVKHAGMQASLEELFAEDKQRLGKQWKTFERYGPPMVTIKKLAEDLAFSDWYDIIYRRASGPIHAFNILAYARPSLDGKAFHVNLAPVDAELDLTIDAALGLLLHTALRVSQILALGKEKEIQALDADVRKWLLEKLEKAGSTFA